MQLERTYSVKVVAQAVWMTPAEIKKRLPMTPQAEEFVLQSREALQRIIDRQDPRLFVVVGPCSIHDLRAARDYAQRLKQLAAEVADTLFIVMRVYFEKPRTIIRTKGNRYGHVVLRGGGGKPNYDSVTVALCEQALAAKKLSTNLVVDCSHENSRKDPALQPLVLHDCMHQILEGNQSLIGFMLESNINFGKQAIPADLSQLQYGVSVTDGCIDWATTEKILLETCHRLKDVLPTRL